MIKSIKQKLSIKIFIITFSLLCISCSGTYLFISQIFPFAYSSLIDSNMQKASIQLTQQLSSYNNIEACESALTNFSADTNAIVWVEDENGNIVPSDKQENTEETVYGDTTITFDDNIPSENPTTFSNRETNYYPITLENGKSYTLAVQFDLLVIQQTKEVLWTIFPYIIFMAFLLSFLCSWLYAVYITRPIVQLSEISKQMAELDFSGQCAIARQDELGCLAQNLNTLSMALETSLNNLQTANEKLQSDIKLEQELEQQKMEFFYAASHELKTPLTILKGHLTGMLNKITGYENHSEYLKRSLSVADRMESLVKELLYIAKTDEKSEPKYQTINLAELIRVQIASLADLLSKKQQQLDVAIPDKVLCKLNPSQMERVLQNILSNAIRYSPTNELIRISLVYTEKKVRCEIENSGIHIPEDNLHHLFEAFYRADNSRSLNTGGTGLGLYIVHKILDAHNAKYGILNTNNGVLFWFELLT